MDKTAALAALTEAFRPLRVVSGITDGDGFSFIVYGPQEQLLFGAVVVNPNDSVEMANVIKDGRERLKSLGVPIVEWVQKSPPRM